ncbi:hypothetical protein CCYA_CCYA03G0815 [Cyanidiococcus yangmingshanensis]|nr:hypothetical protein CCYA_CCYA03G0815 [Cyanidiococcus yangmingshanensis]
MEQQDSSGLRDQELYLGQLTVRDWWKLIRNLQPITRVLDEESEINLTRQVKESGVEELRPPLAPQDVRAPTSETPEDSVKVENNTGDQRSEESLVLAAADMPSSGSSTPTRSSASPDGIAKAPSSAVATSSRIRWAAVVSGGAAGTGHGAPERMPSAQQRPTSGERGHRIMPENGKNVDSFQRGNEASAPSSPESHRRLWQLLQHGRPVLDRSATLTTGPSTYQLDPHWRRPGFANTGNSCYINAVLQALLAVDEFRDIWAALAPILPPELELVERHRCPLVAGWVRLVKDWLAHWRQTRNHQGRTSTHSTPLRPSYFWESERLAAELRPGHQEDAQELLMMMLDGLHSEVLDLLTHLGPDATVMERSSPSDDLATDSMENTEWEMVDRKGRSAVVRTHQVRPTFITTLFSGALRSEVRKAGAKRSAVREPFLMLSLDIDDQRIRTLDDAFRFFMQPEFLDTPETDRTSQITSTVAAPNPDLLRKEVTLDTPLPPVLIVHLKRFSIQADGIGQSKKLLKQLSFPLQLTLNSSWFSAAVPKAQLNEARARRYHLVAVITHLGPDLASGHYIADVLASRPSSSWPHKARSATKMSSRVPSVESIWWQCDDLEVQTVPASTVLSRTAYLLIYRA